MRVAVVGAGVSGPVVAHLLHRVHDVTVLEANDYAGGHTNTVRVDTPNETHQRFISFSMVPSSATGSQRISAIANLLTKDDVVGVQHHS